MNALAFSLAFVSLLLLVGWMALSIWRFGLLFSYSRYAAKWNEFLKIDNHTHAWSIVTVLVAFLIAPAMIQAGDESPLQFLGFFAPLYLIIVAFTPEYQDQEGDDEKKRKKRKRQRIIHYVGTAICSVCTILWLILVLRLWFYIPVGLFVAWVAAYFTNSIKTSYALWLEFSLLVAVYGATLIGG
jgi:hypothetical protein